MSATYPGGEKSINFEAEAAAEGEGDPLEALVGKPFQFSGVTVDGQPLDLSRYQGKVVLIDFWATWCGPCREEMPNIFANYQQHYKDGFEVIAVSVDQDLEALSEFVTKDEAALGRGRGQLSRQPAPNRATNTASARFPPSS